MTSSECRPFRGLPGTRTPRRRVVGAALLLAMALTGCAGQPPAHLRVDDTHFTPCDHAPHCVSSQAPAGNPHHIAPLTYTTDPARARAALLTVLAGWHNVRVVTADARFIHATFTTTLGFVDDVTFILRPAARRIDVKSESRLGYYDFGVNRRRVERIRHRFNRAISG